MNPDDDFEKELNDKILKEISKSVDNEIMSGVKYHSTVDIQDDFKSLADLKKQIAKLKEDATKILDLTNPKSTPTKLTSAGVYAPNTIPNSLGVIPTTPHSIQGSSMASSTITAQLSALYPGFYGSTSPPPRSLNTPQVVYSSVDRNGQVIFRVWDDGKVEGNQFEAAKQFYETLEFEGKNLYRKIEELKAQLSYAKSALEQVNNTLTEEDTSPKAKHIKLTAENTLNYLKR